MTDHPGQVGVIQSAELWLSQTMTWLYTQIRHLPPRIINSVVCFDTDNLDQFKVDNLYGGGNDHILARLLSDRSWRYRRLRNASLIRSCAKRFNALILHSHFGTHAYKDRENASRNGLKHIATFYGYDATQAPYVDPAWRTRYADLFGSLDLCLCEGPYMAGTIAALGCPEENIRVHHLGVDVSTIEFRPRLWKPDETLRVLIAASFTEKKGIPYAIDALSRISKRVDLEVTIIGSDNGTVAMLAEKERIMAALARSGLAGRTRLLGKQPYSALLAEAYRNHIFLQPSVVAGNHDSEGGAPVSIIDMTASGMPVVSTRHCDIPEVLPQSVHHLLANERDVDGLEERLLWLVENPDRWSDITQACRRHVELEFNAGIQGERLAAIYDEVVTLS